jgi:cytochrome P450
VVPAAAHPEVEQRLAAEVRDVLQGRPPDATDLPRWPFAEAVLTETMRLYPPTSGIVRESIAYGDINGYALSVGTNVYIVP